MAALTESQRPRQDSNDDDDDINNNPALPTGDGWFLPIDDNHKTGWVPADYPKGAPIPQQKQ